MTLGLSGQPYYGIAAEGAGNARTVRCACGEAISAITDPDGIAIGVRSHRATTWHQAWLAARLADGTYEAGDIPRERLPIAR